jgi:uncharacterized repeat protein (TIGR01451 family)
MSAGVARAEADLVLSKIVDNARPTPGSSVEFEIVVINEGPDPTVNIEVFDSLPSGLAIPAGMAAFTSQGSYAADSGVWLVGELSLSQTATLTIPAMPQQDTVPGCANNHAVITSSSANDPQPGNDAASAAVYVGGVADCAELILTVMPDLVTSPDCNGNSAADKLFFDFEVFNAGPDVARNVQLALTGTHPGLANVGPNDTAGFDEIAAGDTARGSLGWTFFCEQSPFTSRYEITVEASSILASDSVLSATGQFDIPHTGTCDCTTSLGGSECFVATAAYGSYLDPQVIVLRAFRDDYLLSSDIGRELVTLYYRYSPPIAETIAANQSLRLLTRVLLAPIIYAVTYPRIAFLLLFVAVLVIYMLIRRRRYST